MTDDNVIAFPQCPDLSDELRCRCGSSWWRAAGIVLDQTGHITGYAVPVTCAECGESLPATPADDYRTIAAADQLTAVLETVRTLRDELRSTDQQHVPTDRDAVLAELDRILAAAGHG